MNARDVLLAVGVACLVLGGALAFILFLIAGTQLLTWGMPK